MSNVGLGWQIKLAVVFVPAISLIALCAGLKFPPTERAATAIPAREMFGELLNPLFFILFASMFLTAASELAPGQWVDVALSRTVHMPGILLLVYVSGLMFFGTSPHRWCTSFLRSACCGFLASAPRWGSTG